MIEIDGDYGEGGGQILRGALALALATGQGFRIDRLRLRRARPGLQRQHLTAVTAAQRVSGAAMAGAELGSTTLQFQPGVVRAGAYELDIGSAGSCALVLQAIVPGLARLAAPSRVVVIGGTHNPMAPPFEFLDEALAPQLRAIGWSLDLTLHRHGFYPAGGGRLEARIGPRGAARPLRLVERGARIDQRVRAVAAHIGGKVPERELAVVLSRMNWPAAAGSIGYLRDTAGPGNYVVVSVRFEHVTEVVVALGERGRTAEQVAEAVVDDLRGYLGSTAPVGAHLCDQLLVPLALTAGGELRATAWSAHADSQRELLRRWFGREIEVERDADGVTVRVPAMT